MQFLDRSNLSVSLLVSLLLSHLGVATSVLNPAPAAVAQRPATPGPKQDRPAPVAAPAVQAAPVAALVPVPATTTSARTILLDAPALRMRVELEVSVPVEEFRVRNLLALESGLVIESRWNHSDDLPLAAGRVKLAWTEFEVVDTQLAARLTRLN